MRRRPPVTGVLAVLGALAALGGAVAVAAPGADRAGVVQLRSAHSRQGGDRALSADLPEPGHNQTVARPLGAVVPGSVDGQVSETVDEGVPEGSSWT